MAVNKISNEKIQRLRNKSIEKLPDIVRGISPTELKKKFTGFVLDPTDSIIDEVNRIVEEVNQKQEDSIPIRAVGGIPFNEEEMLFEILSEPTTNEPMTMITNKTIDQVIDLTENWDINNNNDDVIDLTKKWG